MQGPTTNKAEAALFASNTRTFISRIAGRSTFWIFRRLVKGLNKGQSHILAFLRVNAITWRKKDESSLVFSRVLRDSISHFSVRRSVGRSQNCFKGFLKRIFCLNGRKETLLSEQLFQMSFWKKIVCLSVCLPAFFFWKCRRTRLRSNDLVLSEIRHLRNYRLLSTIQPFIDLHTRHFSGLSFPQLLKQFAAVRIHFSEMMLPVHSWK